MRSALGAEARPAGNRSRWGIPAGPPPPPLPARETPEGPGKNKARAHRAHRKKCAGGTF